MRNYTKLAVILFIAIPLTVAAQNYVNNPYTLFGLGDMIGNGFSYNKALGGSSIGLRPHNQVNYLNPASYTAQDTLSFLFHAGISGKQSVLRTNLASETDDNVNLEYLAMGFPILRWCKFSLGVIPYNRIQYNIRNEVEGIPDLYSDYRGEGGFNQFYFGAGFKLNEWASAGFNAMYIFGNMSRSLIIDNPYTTIASTVVKQDYTASDFRYQVGVQAYPTLNKGNKSHQFIFGVTYDIKSDIKTKYSSLTSRRFPSQLSGAATDTFNVVTDSALNIQLPAKLGLALSYIYNKRLLITLEYSNQNFSKGIGIESYTDLSSHSSIRFGTDYTPVPLSDKNRAGYFMRIHYRLGAYYNNTYLKINNNAIIDKGISLGLGLPWRNSQKLFTHTTFNLHYQYGVMGTTSNNLLQENYHRFGIGITLHDFWFMKAKYD